LVLLSDGSQVELQDLHHGAWVQGREGPQQIIWVVPAGLGDRHLYGLNGGPFFFTEDHPFFDAYDPTIQRVIDLPRALNVYPEKAGILRTMNIGDSLLQWNGTAFVPEVITAIDFISPPSTTPLGWLISDTGSDTVLQSFGVHGWLASTDSIEYITYPVPAYLGYAITNFTKPTLAARFVAYQAAGGLLDSTTWVLANVKALADEGSNYINTYLAPTPAPTTAYNSQWIPIARQALYLEFLTGGGQRDVEINLLRAPPSPSVLLSAQFGLYVREKLPVIHEVFGYYPYTDNDDTGFVQVTAYVNYLKTWWESFVYVDPAPPSGRNIY